MKMEEKFNIEPSNKVRDRAKKVRYENDIPKVMKCYSAPRVTLGGGSVTKSMKRQVLIVPPTSQPGYLTSSTAPPRVAKEAGIAPPRVKMAPSRVNSEASVTDPPAHYTREEK